MSATVTAPPPGAAGLASIGELRALRRDQLGWIVDRRARWGDVFCLQPPTSTFGPMFVFACAPDPIRSVLTDRKPLRQYTSSGSNTLSPTFSPSSVR